MYVFRIIDMIDRSKAWYKGEVFATSAYVSTSLSPPLNYPKSGSTGSIGTTVDRFGYLYTSLKNDNGDTPEYNYVGYPVVGETSGKNSWIRSGYANSTRMIAPESGGITESYEATLSGELIVPTGSEPNGMMDDYTSCTCCLLCGVLGGGIVINGNSFSGIDANETESGYGNPEMTGLNSAFTVSNINYSEFSWSITRGSNTPSTYCAGAYLGSWSYIGVTQWTDHKKTINDYSQVNQDEWGNYSLVKGRVGRTYSAEVLLSVREGSLDIEYDNNIIDLSFSVSQLLRALLGKPAAFYFNNQDIGCPWVPHNTNRDGQLVRLTDSDIIVGILQNFEVVEISGKTAKVNMTVSSVPNEYQNYSLAPTTAPDVPPVVHEGTPMTDLGARTELDIKVTANVTTEDILWYLPVDATFLITSTKVDNTAKCTVQGSWGTRTGGYRCYKVTITKVATSFSNVRLTVLFRYVNTDYALVNSSRVFLIST